MLIKCLFFKVFISPGKIFTKKTVFRNLGLNTAFGLIHVQARHSFFKPGPSSILAGFEDL